MVRERACGVFDGLPMNKIVLIFASLLMGCGVNWWSATPTHTPDGREGYIVTVAHHVGRYALKLGDLLFAYVDGLEGEDKGN